MNPNPTKARRSKKRGKPGTLEDARALLWRALKRAGELLETEDPDLSLKAIHAISQGAGSYARLVTAGELEARLVELEARLGEGDGGPRLGQGAA